MSVLASVTTHRELVENLTMREIKSRYKQSILGFTWAVANPFIYAIIYTVVVQKILKQHTPIATPIFAYYGLLFWNLFATGISAGTESLVSNLPLITKVYFPREVFPVAAVASKVMDFGFGLVGLIPLLFYYRLMPSAKIILVVPLLVVMLMFTLGISMLCASANLFYRDVRQVVGLILNVMFYFVPIFYQLSQLGSLRTLYLLNPMATIIEATRRAAFPQSGGMHEMWPFIFYATLTSCATLVIGYVVFKRQEARFAEFI